MIIDRNLSPFIVHDQDSIEHALQKISRNSKRLVYCLSESGVLEGIVTDGDFRRWVVSVDNIDLSVPVREIANAHYLFAREADSRKHIESMLSQKITAVPIVADSGRLVAIAWQQNPTVRLGEFVISDEQPAFVIAEIGNNHNGSIELAKKLVDEAAEAGADCAKFQMRDIGTLYSESGIGGSEDLGTEYVIDLLKRFQLSTEEMFEILDYTRKAGLVPLCTPWDLPSLKRLVDYGVLGFKIASADLTNHELLTHAARTGLPLLVSTGMSYETEILDSVKLLRDEGATFVLLQCSSSYPAPLEDINLAYMKRLREMSDGPIGYSGHERGYDVVIAAVAMGAKVVEKHFTLDREMEGNDHKVSLLPEEFRAMVESIRNVERAIGSARERIISQGERLNREVLAKSLVAARDIAQGEKISNDMVVVRSPGRGLQPSRLRDLIGKKAHRMLAKGEAFFESDISGETIKPRRYQFARPWGIPVRYYDFSELVDGVPLDFVEMHFSYRDLDLKPGDYIPHPTDLGLVVHSPELFSGDHILDLASQDAAYQQRSIDELQRVIARTQEMLVLFPKSPKPLIIINAGGATSDGFMPIAHRVDAYARIADALDQLDTTNVEIIIQTMPPFPWHFGGQRYHNLFMDPYEIVAFCEQSGHRLCLDVSHSQLACNYFGWSMLRFLELTGPHVAHLHLVDARGDRDEGLQIGAGDVDFAVVASQLDKFAPNAGFIPEIWQGHKNGGEGFWVALDRLERVFQSD